MISHYRTRLRSRITKLRRERCPVSGKERNYDDVGAEIPWSAVTQCARRWA
jgi:hypothetical protein